MTVRSIHRFDRSGAWLSAGCLLAGLIFAEVGLAQPREQELPYRMLNGMESIRLDANKIVVYRGSAADNSARHLIRFRTSVTADVTVVGENGRDNIATPADIRDRAGEMKPDSAAPGGFRPVYRDGHPYAGRPLSGWYMPVYAADATGRAAVFLTRQQSSQRTDRDGDAQISSQFVARRNAAIAYFYDAKHGFRPMVCYGWPQPFCLWTRIPPFDDLLSVLKAGTATEVTAVDAREFVPGIGRILRMQVVLRGIENGGGVRLYTLPRGKGLLAGHVSGRGDVRVTFLEMSLTSGRTFHYSVDQGVSVDIQAMGFSILQPN